MALPNTNIGLMAIRNMMGGPMTNIRISDYYKNAASGFASSILGIPSTGSTIGLGHFRGKAKITAVATESTTITGTNTFAISNLATKFINPVSSTLSYTFTATQSFGNVSLSSSTMNVIGDFRNTTYAIQVTATSPEGGTATWTLSVTETAAQSPQRLVNAQVTPLFELWNTQRTNMPIAGYFSDPNGLPLTHIVTSVSGGATASFSGTTLVITGPTTNASATWSSIYVTARNGKQGTSDAPPVEIRVYMKGNAPAFTASPLIDSRSGLRAEHVYRSILISNYFTNWGSLGVTITSSPPNGSSIENTGSGSTINDVTYGRQVYLNYTPALRGQNYPTTITATDLLGRTATMTFTFMESSLDSSQTTILAGASGTYKSGWDAGINNNTTIIYPAGSQYFFSVGTNGVGSVGAFTPLGLGIEDQYMNYEFRLRNGNSDLSFAVYRSGNMFSLGTNYYLMIYSTTSIELFKPNARLGSSK